MPQLSFVVTQLQDEGYVISHVDQRDRSTTYVLQHIPEHLKPAAKAITRPQEARPEEPTMFEQHEAQEEKKLSIKDLLSKIAELGNEYRAAPTPIAKKIIDRRIGALINAVSQIDRDHPIIAKYVEWKKASLSSGRRLAR
jgi:hypothetical protein